MKAALLTKKLRARVMATLLAGAVGAFVMTPAVQALPTNPTHDAAVTIANSNNNLDMNISSTADNNVIKWGDFSIAKGETVAFDTKNYLNQVTGNKMSEIWGTLKGGGNIYLINPNGILFGAGSQVDVGALYASTRTLSDADIDSFKAGNAISALADASLTGNIINMGDLTATKNITMEGNNLIFAGTDRGISNLPSSSDSTVKLVVAQGGSVQVGTVSGSDTAGYTLAETNHRSSVKDTTMEFNLVRNVAEFQAIKDAASANYILAGTLDMSGVTNYTPIGNFTGDFDGLNYTIDNLEINNNGNGLFSSLTAPGVIENMGRTGGSTEYTGGANAAIGSIVGWMNSGTIRNIFNSSNVIVEGSASNEHPVGGIVGGSNGGTIENVYNSGSVSNSGSHSQRGIGAGGIIGKFRTGTLKNAFNAGEVVVHNTNGGVAVAGGILGWHEDNADLQLANVYNTGTINAVGDGTNYTGGIYGADRSNIVNNGGQAGGLTVTNAYNGGVVSNGTGNAISGTNVGITVQDSYYSANTGAAFTGAEGNTQKVTSAVAANSKENLLRTQTEPATGVYRTVNGTVYRTYQVLLPASSSSGSPAAPTQTPAAPPQTPAASPLAEPQPVTQTSVTTLEQVLASSGQKAEAAGNVTMKDLTEAENSAAPNVQTTASPTETVKVAPGSAGAAPANVSQSFAGDGMLTMVNKGATPPPSMSAEEVAARQSKAADAQNGTPDSEQKSDSENEENA